MTGKAKFVSPNSGNPHLWQAVGQNAVHATWFTCEHCGQRDHHLARFCRGCGKPVSFETAYAGDVLNPSASPAPVGSPTMLLDATAVGGKRVLHLGRAWGLLVVGVEDAGLFLFSVADPQEAEALNVPELDGESVFAVVQPPPEERSRSLRPRLLAVFPSGVAQVSLLPEPTVDWIYRTGPEGRPMNAAFAGDSVAIFISRSDNGQPSTDIVFLRDTMGRHPVERSTATVAQSPASAIVPLPSGDFFFHTSVAGHVCGGDGSIRSYPSPVPLSDRADSLLWGERVYVPAGDAIAVFQLESGDVWRFSPTLVPPFQFALDAITQQLLTVDMEGVKSIDALSGQVKWDSKTALGFTFLGGQVRPIRIGDELLVAGSTAHGQQRIQGVTPFGPANLRIIAELEGAIPLALESVGVGVAVSVSLPGLQPRGEVRLVGMR